MSIKELIKKLFEIKEKEDKEQLDKYIKDIHNLKNKVTSAITEGYDCFLVNSYHEKLFASNFFDEIENWGSNTTYDRTYRVIITEQSLKRLDKELKKYNLDVY